MLIKVGGAPFAATCKLDNEYPAQASQTVLMFTNSLMPNDPSSRP